MPINRRAFLRNTGLSALPLVAPLIPAVAAPGNRHTSPPAPERAVNFTSDGVSYDPTSYISKLQEINAAQPIGQDFYGNGGAVVALEKKFTEITGKERAIFMPTGTMANQLAILVLSGENTKVFVQETSHVYRDEADAAQSVHNKRLIPVAQGEAGFTLEQLQQAVEYHRKGEVFESGMGAISIENPVRRADGKFVPFDELKKIAAYARQQGFKLHLDGARIYLASAWSGVSIKEYSSLFDTVYISLYKYLGAAAGAILCGDKAVIDKMTHLIKIHGGTMFGNWANAGMALHHLDGLDARLQQTKKRSEELFAQLNQLPELKITPIPSGTNIYLLQFAKGVDGLKIATALFREHNIRMGRPSETGLARFSVNETILFQDLNTIVNAFKAAIKSAK